MHIALVLKDGESQSVDIVDDLTLLNFAFFLELAQVWLDYDFVKLVKDLLLVLRVLAESENQILGRHTACLGACKEEG